MGSLSAENGESLMLLASFFQAARKSRRADLSKL
jgi:hypothetical protein